MWRRHEPLAGRTTLRVGGPADWFAAPESEEECAAAWAEARRNRMRAWVLGGGSNLLVADAGVPGAVICMRRMRPRSLEWRGGRLHVSAGMPLRMLVARAAREGWSGVEFLAGVPGLVGGAARMNAGGAEGTFGERVAAVRVLDEDGRLAVRRGGEIEWAYRACGLSDPLILGVELDLAPSQPERVAAATRQARERKRAAQPLDKPSAGCVFRNPPGASAGQLLDEAGLKGARVGGAAVSDVHANFIVNLGGAKASDIYALIQLCQKRVLERSGVALELEIHTWMGGEG